MEMHYGPEWPTEEKIKRREMVAEEARYIFLHDISNGDRNETSELRDNGYKCCCKGLIVGFVHFRFVLEEEVPVIYIYELQLDPHFQGKGLGEFLMQLIELIACKNKMGAVVLTVQRANTSAMNFYTRKLGYSISAISPSRLNLSVSTQCSNYTGYFLHCYLSKTFTSHDHHTLRLELLEKSYEILCKTFDHEAQAVLKVCVSL